MFMKIEPVHYKKYQHLLTEMFELRKLVFHDTLKWNVPVHGDIERDSFDDLGPVYLVWCDAEASVLYASQRLLPTTGPTLLSEVFHDTIPDAAAISAPGIWEATRSCVHAGNLKRDFPKIPPGQAFGFLLLATVECALAHGIETVVANYEPRLTRLYKRAGAVFDQLGQADGFGKYPVCCGAFEISERVVEQMRSKLGIADPLYGTVRDHRLAAA